MNHINKQQLQELQIELSNSLQKSRQKIVDILMNSSNETHHLAAQQIKQVSPDELLDLLPKFKISCVSDEIFTIRRIDAALNNIQIDIYGMCADCESEITVDELKINPARQRCLECEKNYQKQKNNHFKL